MENLLLNLAYDLCEIKSPSYEENLVLEYVENFLKSHNLKTRRLELEEQPGRYNLLAFSRELPQWALILCTHLDTVKPHIAPRIENQEILWGRGACDAKGIAAAMILALIEQVRQGHHDLALLFTVGEEDASDGARSANRDLKNRARYVLIGEPTELKAAYAQKGSLVFDLEAEGVEAHSALAHLGESAIHKLVCDIHQIINYPWPSHELFGDTLINFGIINGGQARNTLASKAIAQGIMRTATGASKLAAIIASLLSSGLSMKLRSSCDPFEYFVPDGFKTMLASFGSDAPYLRDVGKLMMLGPGSLSLAHQENEHIALLDLYEAYVAYQDIARQIRL